MRYIVLISILLITACEKDAALHEINNLNNNQIYAFAHGGMGIVNVAPISSYQSVIRSMEFNPHGIEIDVQLTSDGHLVAYHHEKLDDYTNGSGFVNVNTLETILNLHYNVGPLNNYTLFSLDSFFLNEPRAKDFLYVFDLKLFVKERTEEFYNNVSDALAALIEKNNLQNRVLIECDAVELIHILQQLEIPAHLALSSHNAYKSIEIASALNLFGIIIESDDIDKEAIKYAHNNGLRVILFNIKTESENIEAIKKCPDYIITDRLKHLTSVLN